MQQLGLSILLLGLLCLVFAFENYYDDNEQNQMYDEYYSQLASSSQEPRHESQVQFKPTSPPSARILRLKFVEQLNLKENNTVVIELEVASTYGLHDGYDFTAPSQVRIDRIFTDMSHVVLMATTGHVLVANWRGPDCVHPARCAPR